MQIDSGGITDGRTPAFSSSESSVCGRQKTSGSMRFQNSVKQHAEHKNKNTPPRFSQELPELCRSLDWFFILKNRSKSNQEKQTRWRRENLKEIVIQSFFLNGVFLYSVNFLLTFGRVRSDAENVFWPLKETYQELGSFIRAKQSYWKNALDVIVHLPEFWGHKNISMIGE